LRSLRLPARYRIYKIQPEQELWKWISEEDGQLVNHLCGALMEQEHIEAEIYLNGMKACDPCQDCAFEEGLKRLGIPLERKLATHASGVSQLRTLASIDQWAQERQQAGRFRKHRQLMLLRINEQLDRIRFLGQE
jgi:hypothetical protein